MNGRGIVVLMAAVVVWGLLAVALEPGEDEIGTTRTRLRQTRRLMRSDIPSLARKNEFLKDAMYQTLAREPDAGLGEVALETNRTESLVRLPYFFGGNITNNRPGLDDAGFIHGLRYYLGHCARRDRDTAATLADHLGSDAHYRLIHDSTQDGAEPLDIGRLRVGDVVLITAAGSGSYRNNPTATDHVGVVSVCDGDIRRITHCADPDRNAGRDLVGSPGSGINTIDAQDFLAGNPGDRVVVFRRKRVTEHCSKNKLAQFSDMP